MGEIIVPNYEKYKRNSGVLGFYYEKGLNTKISFGIFAIDFEIKLELAIHLIRKYFGTDELDAIAYDIVKSYCLSEQYCVANEGALEATNEQFYKFFNLYIENLEKITRGISQELSTPKR